MSRVKAVMTGSTRAMPMGANDGHRPTCTEPMYPTARAPERSAAPDRQAAQPRR